MDRKQLTRRQFMAATSTGAAALVAAPPAQARGGGSGVPAILGGQPVRTAPFPRWPNFRDADERAIVPVLRGGVWSRAKMVDEAERRFAKLMARNAAWRPRTALMPSSPPSLPWASARVTR